MKNILLISLLLSISFASIRIRPEIVFGKMTNGNNYEELVPIKLSYQPNNEWTIGYGWSLGFEKPRGELAISGYNHRGWKHILSIQFKPIKFLEIIIPDSTITDFAISYRKQIGSLYDGSTLDIGRLDYNDYDEISIGFDFNI
jgi:hypothetical protein